MISAQSNLTMVGLNTPTPQVFWKGQRVPGVTGIKVDWEDDEQRVKIRITDGWNMVSDQQVLDEMRAAGIMIKEVA